MMQRISIVSTMFLHAWLCTQSLYAQATVDHEGAALVASAVSSIDDYHRGAETIDSVIRVVYFHPSDREPLAEWRDRLSRIIADVSDFYRTGLRRFGINDRGFQFENSTNGYVFHLVRGLLPASEYQYDSGTTIERELRVALHGKINFEREHVLVIHGLCHREKDGRYVFNAPYYGSGSQRRGICHAADCELLDPLLLTARDRKIVYTEHYYRRQEQTVALFNTWYLGGIAHELGHGLGLPHDAGGPWERDQHLTALMGSGNQHYREERWGGNRPAFLSLGSTLRLLSHPLVTNSSRGRFADADMTLEGMKFSSEGQSLKLVGKIESEIPAYAVIAYLWRPPKWPGNPQNDHRSVSYPASVLENRFELLVDQFQSGDHRLRLSTLQCNGAATNFDFHLHVDEDSEPNIVQLNSDWLVAQAESAVLSGAANAGSLVSAEAIAKATTDDAKGKLQVLSELLTPPTPIELASTDAKTVHLSDASWVTATVGWRDVARNHFDREKRHRNSIYLELKGKFYAKGLYAHSKSAYVFDLQSRWKKFTATIGLRDGASQQGSAIFVVRGDGNILYQSPVLREGQSADICIDVADVKKLELVADGAEGHIHNSWAIWAVPRLLR